MRLFQLVNDYWQWLIGLSALAAGLSWIPGAGIAIGILVSVLKILASTIESLSPIISGIFQGIIWLWQKAVWPGIVNICSSISSIFTVLIICGSIYGYMYIKYNSGSILITHRPNIEDVVPTKEVDLFSWLPWNW